MNGQGQCVGQLGGMKDCPIPKAKRVFQVEKRAGSDREELVDCLSGK